MAPQDSPGRPNKIKDLAQDGSVHSKKPDPEGNPGKQDDPKHQDMHRQDRPSDHATPKKKQGKFTPGKPGQVRSDGIEMSTAQATGITWPRPRRPGCPSPGTGKNDRRLKDKPKGKFVPGKRPEPISQSASTSSSPTRSSWTNRSPRSSSGRRSKPAGFRRGVQLPDRWAPFLARQSASSLSVSASVVRHCCAVIIPSYTARGISRSSVPSLSQPTNFLSL